MAVGGARRASSAEHHWEMKTSTGQVSATEVRTQQNLREFLK